MACKKLKVIQLVYLLVALLIIAILLTLTATKLESSSLVEYSEVNKDKAQTNNVKSISDTENKGEKTEIGQSNNSSKEDVHEVMHIITVFPLLGTDAWNKQGYNTTDLQLVKRREKEYVECLLKNIQQPTVTKIHIFSDRPDILSQKLEKEYAVPSSKLHYHNSSSNPTYLDLFKYASDNLQNKLVFIVNADNYLAGGFDKVDVTWWQNNPDVMYALTRHSLPTDNKECKMGPIGYCDEKGTYFGSHDGFMFYLHKSFPDNFLNELTFPSHACGSENVVIYAFRKYLHFAVTNPCRRLVLYHNHCTDMRAPDTKRARVNINGKSGLAAYTS